MLRSAQAITKLQFGNNITHQLIRSTYAALSSLHSRKEGKRIRCLMYSITTTTPLRLTTRALPKTACTGSFFVIAGSYSTLTSVRVRQSPIAARSKSLSPRVAKRGLSSTIQKSTVKEFFPKVETKQIVHSESSWQHPV